MERDVQQEIIDYIKRNRVSTTEVADCLGKRGEVNGVYPINRGMHRVGIVKYVYGFLESNWGIHEQIRDTQKGDIVLIDGISVNERALIGELVVKFLLLYRGAAAVVVRGLVRDANDLIRMGYAVWSKGVSPVGCFNFHVEETEEIQEYVQGQKELFHNAIAVCDDSGVVIIPAESVSPYFLEKLEKIEEQEDQWFHCIDRLKWDTFDTVCLKRYLEDSCPKNNVLVIGGARSQCHVIDLLHKLNYHVLVVDCDLACQGSKMADEFLGISTADVEGLIEIAREKKVKGVVAVQSDLGLVTATRVAIELGLKALPLEVVELYTNKYKMREHLKKNGFLCPDYKKCRTVEELKLFASTNGFPVVMKPMNSQGSRGVVMVKSEDDFQKIKFSQGYTKGDDAVIVEEFLGNLEFTIEGIVVNKKHYTLAISKKTHYDNLEYVSKELYYSWESDYDDLEILHNKLIESTGLPFGITHSEYIKTKDGFTLVEFAARGGGSMIASHIVPAVSGWDIEDIYLRQILQEEVEIPPVSRKCAVLKFISLEEGYIKKIAGVHEIKRMEQVLHFELRYQEGEFVKPVTNDTDRHGYFIAWAENKEELDAIIDKVGQVLEVQYER